MSIFGGNERFLTRFRQGDEAVLSKVYLEYYQHVALQVKNGVFDHSSQVRIGGIPSRDTQLEITQEVFLRAFSNRARQSYDGVRPFRNYLAAITKNVVIDYFRKQNTDALGHVLLDDRNESGDDQSGATMMKPKTDADHIEERMHWQQCVSASREFMSTLNPKEHNIAMYRYRDGLPQRTVAHLMHTSRWQVRAVEKRLQDGLNQYLHQRRLLS